MSKKTKIGIVLVLLGAIFIFLNLTGFSKEIKNFFYLISSPFQKALWQTGDSLSGFFEGIWEMKTLKKENEELKLKIQELLSENSSLKETEKENDFLRQALSLELEKEFELKMAEVIGKDISRDSVLINKGSEDGLTPGLPVITSQKVLLGRIGEVYNNFSEVLLISNKESSFDAKIVDSETYGVAKGKGRGQLSFELIPREQELKRGDLLITTSLGGIFPKGLLVGEVREIKKSDVDPFQTAEIKPALDLKELKNLFIITEF